VITVPKRLDWWRAHPGGAAWLDRLPRLVGACAAAWDLRVGAVFADGAMSLAVAVELPDRTPAVLKLNFPGGDNEHEGDALQHWNGRGAIRLLARDHERAALLLERCVPGTRVAEVELAARIAVDLLRQLWRPPALSHPFRLVSDEAEAWAAGIERDWEALGRPFERRLVDAAASACRDLGPTQGDQVLLHGDLHSGNVLRAQREPWLAIDPTPLVGEREWDAARLLLDTTGRRRLDHLADELALDRERLRQWGIVSALVWGISANKLERDMVACARLLEDLG
jgi:streptomycin 6-kinase